MIWLGYVYLLILILFGASALVDDVKSKKMGRFAISFVPLAVLVIATVAFLFLPKPGGLAWLVFAGLAVSIPLLAWDAIQDVRNLGKTDPEFGTGGAIFSVLLTALVFAPAVILGVLWAR